MSPSADPAVPTVDPVDAEQLGSWITRQRWFASKGRLSQINVVESIVLSDEPPLTLALIEVRARTDTGPGAPVMYQLLVGRHPSEETSPDALDDEPGRAALAELLLSARHVRSGDHSVEFHWLPPDDHTPRLDATARPLGAEQSNSSLLIDDQVVLKLFRRLEPGVNPELEMLRFLRSHSFTDVPELLGWIDLHGDSLDATLGVAQRFVAGGRDGWELTLDALEQGSADCDDLRQLGAVIGSMHSVLGSNTHHPAFAPEQPSAEWLALLAVDVDRHIEDLFSSLSPSPALEPLAGRSDEVRAVLDSLTHGPGDGRLIRTHGDLHLGQVLRTSSGWVVLDFEGEPARSLVDRRHKRSPLRDVAGMLRSFAYAASAVQLQRGCEAPPGWLERARYSFLTGYFGTIDPALVPEDRSASDQLIALFELEKAVYELDYEINNRPDWAAIPVAAIRRILEEQTP